MKEEKITFCSFISTLAGFLYLSNKDLHPKKHFAYVRDSHSGNSSNIHVACSETYLEKPFDVAGLILCLRSKAFGFNVLGLHCGGN